jgi:hypothetical protein
MGRQGFPASLQKSLVRSMEGGVCVQPTGISPNLVRLLTATAPDLMTELLTPGKVLDADVVSVYQDKAVLAFGRGVRLEVTLQTPLHEGQRVRVQVQPQPQGQQQPGQAQGQAPAGASRQAAVPGAQPAPVPGAQPVPVPGAQPAPVPGAQPAPLVLKVIGNVPPEASGRAQTAAQAGHAPGQAQAPAQEAAGAPAAAQRSGALRDVAATTFQGQPAPVANQTQAQQPVTPQVLWLPIPLPGGAQGWAQLHIQEEDSPRARAVKGGPVQQVRIWWETPALGPIQVMMDAAPASLSAIFTAAAADSKSLLDQSIVELQQRLAEAGFPEARVGCRAPAPGEAVEPARIDGASRLDKRL